MNNSKNTPKLAKKVATQNVTLSGNEKISIISNLNTMLTAGIPILETVDSLLEDSKGNQRKLLETLRSDLMQGQPVHTSFAKFPKIFDKVTVNIVKAAEEAGTLDVTLKDLKDNIRREMEFSDKIKSALIYPIFIAFVFVGVMLMILTVVVPKLQSAFANMRVTLPLPTRALFFMSHILLKNTLIVGLVTLLLVVGSIFFFKTQKKLVLHFLTSLPLISNLAQLIDLTRFTRSMYLLLSAGIPIVDALALTGEVVTKRDIAIAVADAHKTVSSGKKLSEAFRQNKKAIPPIMIRITEAGEKSGSLDKAMLDASEFLDYQVDSALKTVTSLIEPIMLVGMGIGIGGMMLAIIAPIYSIISQISPN